MKTNRIIYLLSLSFLLTFIFMTGHPIGAGYMTLALVAFTIAGKPLKELEEREADVIARLEELNELAKKENRSFSEDENKEWNGLHKELKDLEPAIEQQRSLDEAKQRRASGLYTQRKREREEREISGFSYLKVIRSQVPDLNEKLDGIEAEMIQEGRNEMREAGVKTTGLVVPTMVLKKRAVLSKTEQRNMLAGTDTAGQELVPSMQGSFIDALFASLVIDEMGAERLTGLQGTFDMPREVSALQGAWKGEGSAADEDTPVLEDGEFSPHKYTAWTRYSRDLLIQSSIDIEAYVQSRLRRAVALEVDRVAMEGSGIGNEPTGILNTAGIGAPVMAADGGNITRDLVARLIKEVKVDNADRGALGFVTNPKVETELMLAKLDAGSGRFLLENSGDPLLGYRYLTTTQCPSDLTAGNGENLSALIFGNWNGLKVGNWGGIELIVNPYSEDKEGKVRVSIHSWWDIFLEHPQYFSALRRIITND